MANPLTKKLGPLPVGVWGIIGAGGFILYRHFSGASSAPTAGGYTDAAGNVYDANGNLVSPAPIGGESGGPGLGGGGGGTSVVSPDGGSLGQPLSDVATTAVGALGDIGVAQAGALDDIGTTLAGELGNVANTLASQPARNKNKKQRNRGRYTGTVSTRVQTRHKLSNRPNTVVTKTVTRRKPVFSSTRRGHPATAKSRKAKAS